MDNNNTTKTMTPNNKLNLTICLDKAKLVLSSDEDLTEEHYTPEDIDAMFVLCTTTTTTTTTNSCIKTVASRKKPN